MKEEDVQLFTWAQVYEKAPTIVHMALCRELVQVSKQNPDKVPREIPEAIKVLDAIDLLEKIYPQLKQAQ